jgi:uncharacterized protein (TIGR00290 family)
MTGASCAAVSWSGGKDSCLALLVAAESGLSVRTLLTTADEDGASRSHALPRELLRAQADAIGAELRFVAIAGDRYAEGFAQALRDLRDDGHTHVVYGDIDLAAHREWLEPITRAADLEACFPLWGRSRAAVADEIVRRGIQARLVCVDESRLDADFCGADYDDALLARLPEGVCRCGEDGEFHTFVWNAPCFERPIAIAAGARMRIASRPPLAPTHFTIEVPRLVASG